MVHIAHAVDDGVVRPDINPDELANYCLHALNGAAGQATPPHAGSSTSPWSDSVRPELRGRVID